MKLLFVHETKLKEDVEGNLYTGGSYSQKVWDRYLAISDSFRVIARKEETIYEKKIAEKTFNKFDKEKIKFVHVPSNVSSIESFLSVSNRNKIHGTIKKEVENCDGVIARLPSSYGNLAIKYAKKLNKPYLVEVVGCAWDSLWNYNIKGKILAISRYLEMKASISDAPYVIYVTQEFLQKRYPTKGLTTNCSNVMLEGFSDNVLLNREEKIKIMEENSIKVIGTIGAVDVKYKGQELIIEALSQLKKQGITNFEYQLVGNGNQEYLSKLAIEKNVQNQVKFIGSLPHKEVFDWLDDIHIYAQPSKTEGLPRGLIEAMSRGIPSFGTQVGGISELLDSEFLIKQRGSKVNQIVSLLKRIDKKTMLTQANRNYIEAKKYEKNIIEKRRNAFLLNFKSSLN